MLQKSVRQTTYDPATREVEIIASDEAVDRYGDIIRVEGWDLRGFKKNPVLLFAHNSRNPPIGTVTRVAKEEVNGKPVLMAKAKLLPEGTYDFADLIGRIMEAGALRASSVGFIPTVEPKAIFGEDKRVTGFEYNGQELLELSIVPVPANPNALTLARSCNIGDREFLRVFIPEVEVEVPQQGARDTQTARAFAIDLLNWERERMRRNLRIQGVI